MKTILAALAHPDDEIGCAGTLAVHAAAGDRVVLLFLTRGEMTEALGPLTLAEVAAARTQHAHQAAAILGAEARLLEFPDTRIDRNPDTIHAVARVLAEIRPDAVITWGDAWERGMRHPDHQACGEIVRGAITIARIARAVHPHAPHRAPAPVFTLRSSFSTLPETAIDVSSQLDRLHTLAAFYRARVAWPPHEWLVARLETAGNRYGCAAAELFDAWESEPGLHARLI